MTPQETLGAANRKACEVLGKTLPQIEGLKSGDVFECENARQPEGCGHTVHCSGCAIRQTVLDTMQTENPHTRVPATLNHLAGSTRIDLLISTETHGNVVFLRIDELKRT